MHLQQLKGRMCQVAIGDWSDRTGPESLEVINAIAGLSAESLADYAMRKYGLSSIEEAAEMLIKQQDDARVAMRRNAECQ